MIKLSYGDYFASAKAIANLIPNAIEHGADPDDVKQAAWGVANLIEMGWTYVDDKFREDVEASAASIAAERLARERSEPVRLPGKAAKGTRT